MILFVRIGAWIALVASTGSVAVAWSEPRPDLTPADAVAVAEGAFARIGYEATAVGNPAPGERALADGRTIDVQIVKLDIDGEEIVVEVRGDVGELVHVDDVVGTDGSRYLLEPGEFEELGRFRDQRATRRRAGRNARVSLAAILSAALAVVFIAFGGRIIEASEEGTRKDDDATAEI